MYIIGIIIWRIISTRHKARVVRIRILLAGIISAPLILFTVWATLLDIDFGPDSEELVAHTFTCESDIYIFDRYDLADGFIETRIAKRIGWLPFEKTLFTLDEPFHRTNTENGNTYLSFGSSGHIRFECSKGSLQRVR